MSKHNTENIRIKRRYFIYLREARGQNEKTVDAVAKSLVRFEEYTKQRDFKTFNTNQAVGFKNYLAEQKAMQTGEKLSKATLNTTLSNLKKFFQWLSEQPSYKSRFKYSDADYFNLSEKEIRVASAKREQKAPTMEQVKHVIALMPVVTEIEQRNRALLAFTLLTGARDSAIASMKLKHVDLVAGSVSQDAREVRTKFSKTFTTFFFPVGDDVRAIVDEWVKYLREVKLWGNDDPLFPPTAIEYGNSSRQFEAAGFKRVCWKTTSPIRAIFKEAFERAGLPYFNPHSIRDTLVHFGQGLCKCPEDFKAWSQNLGHEQVLTTFLSYGEVECRRQGEIIQELGKPKQAIPTDMASMARVLFDEWRKGEIGK